MNLSGSEIGKISKKWSGPNQEFLTHSDDFGVNFPIDLDVRMKAVLIGACILIVSIHLTKFRFLFEDFSIFFIFAIRLQDVMYFEDAIK